MLLWLHVAHPGAAAVVLPARLVRLFSERPDRRRRRGPCGLLPELEGPRAPVPAVVLPQDCPDSRVRLLQISMNRLRGQLDLTAVSETLLDLTADGLDLSLSGYSEGEITAMLDSAIPVDPNDLAGDASFEPDGDEDKPEKVTPFELKIELDSADELREVKRLLKKAGGRGKSMGEGLRKVLGLT